ncbi:MAG: helix-turn-helix transcriptional regulator [Alphaproteobacteria bacterium]|nr:helix-turn-helix transcriptional regulator [Alphaproteobacteria bacterium]
MGVTQTAIYKLETGASDLDTKWMKKISDVLGVKPYELLPQEWQPQAITEEEQQILALFRKKTNTQNSSTQTEDKTNLYKSKQS